MLSWTSSSKPLSAVELASDRSIRRNASQAQGPDFIAPKRMHRWFAVLDSPDVQRRRSSELDLAPFQVADFRCPQAPRAAVIRQRAPFVVMASQRGRQCFIFIEIT
jgi:hypothetical protein